MNVLVFGATGQVARELTRRVPRMVRAEFLGRDIADLTVPGAGATAVQRYDADLVMNVAAYTAVDRAEREESIATRVNGDAPAEIAQACAERGIPLLHMSTDYVFNGVGDLPIAPDHPVEPLNAYGRSKLLGERGVRASGVRHLIVRTSWVVSAHGANFVSTMLRLGRSRDTIQVVADQIGGPTPATALADALFVAASALYHGHPGGTYHLAGAPDVSWAEFAREIMAQAQLMCGVEDIASEQYQTAAKRPHNSRLNCRSFEHEFGVARPDWREGLRDILRELRATA